MSAFSRLSAGFPTLPLIASLYLAQAVPVLLVGTALPPILRAQGADLATIGALGLLIVPWTLKFLWAPVVDRFGSRRAWILGGQAAVLAALAIVSLGDPAGPARALFLPLLVFSVAAGIQDVAIDGLAVEALPPDRHAAGGAIQSGAAAAGLVIGGAVALHVYDFLGWTATILSTAALSAVATAPVLLLRTTAAEAPRPRRSWPSPGRFFARRGMLALLALGMLFRLPDGMLSATARPFLVDQGLELSRIGTIYGVAGALLGLVAIPFATWLLRRIGPIGFLLAVTALRAAVHLGLALNAADLVPGAPVSVALAVAHAFTGYLEATALYALFLRAASPIQAATDFGLLSGAAALSFAAGSVLAGLLAEGAGYPAGFATGAAICLFGGLAGTALIARHAPLAARF